MSKITVGVSGLGCNISHIFATKLVPPQYCRVTSKQSNLEWLTECYEKNQNLAKQYITHRQWFKLVVCWIVLLHLLHLCKTRFSAITFRTGFHHVLPLKHGHLWDQPLFPNLCAVEHILGVVCSDEQQFLECSSVSIDWALFKGNHGRFHLRCSTDIHQQIFTSDIIIYYGKGCRFYTLNVTFNLWNSSHLQIPTRFHKHTMQLVVEVPQNGLSTLIFWITFIVFHIGVILFHSCASIGITLECLISVIQISVKYKHNMNKSEIKMCARSFFKVPSYHHWRPLHHHRRCLQLWLRTLKDGQICWFFHVNVHQMLEDLKDHCNIISQHWFDLE